jgi:AcrR family transcriptional regulator
MPPGRPRAFDPEDVLEKALCVFWQKGYEGTSMPDLTAAMGINRPSIYAAFGNKESLFRKVVELYIGRIKIRIRQALDTDNLREGMATLLTDKAYALVKTDQPKGCLLVQGALTCSEASEDVRRELEQHRQLIVAILRERFEEAHNAGHLPKHADATALALFMGTIMHGISVQASSGASIDDLLSIGQTAMKAWPE